MNWTQLTDSFALMDLSLNVVILYILYILKQNHRANIFLGLFIFCSASPIVFFVTPYMGFMLKSVILSVICSLIAISGVFLNLYISILSGEQLTFKSRKVSSLLIFPVSFMFLMYLSFVSSANSSNHSLLALFVGLMIFLLPIVFISIALFKIKIYEVRIENWFSDIENINMNWLISVSIPALIQYLLWFLFIALSWFNIIHSGSVFVMPQLILIGIIPLISIHYVIRQPEIFRANRELASIEQQDDLIDSGSRKKYEKQHLDEDIQKEFCDRVLFFMKEHKPYLNEELTIRDLSSLTDIPVHQLSIAINSMIGKNFTTFVNEYRVHEVLFLMKNEPLASILTLAYKSGFNSKSAFNKTFKKITGKTPSEYRQADLIT